MDVQVRLGELEPINHSFWVTQEPRSYGIIGLDLLVAHQLAIFPSSAQLCKIGSGRSTKLFAAADLPTPISQKSQLTEPKHNHELEILLDDYKAALIKPRRAGGQPLRSISTICYGEALL